MRNDRRLAWILVIAMVLIAGCDENERVAQVAKEAADRQAKQNEEMARVTNQVAEGSKQLVEADAKARTEIVAVGRELQARQVVVDHQRDQLEVERKDIAGERQTESLWAPVVQGMGILLFSGLVIGLCWFLLHGLGSDGDASQELNELLVMELAAETPKFPTLSGPADSSPPRLNPGGSTPALPPASSSSDN